jgi:3-phenylpropionate/trans-cinnamate dioxygenase ferredoxin subunit
MRFVKIAETGELATGGKKLISLESKEILLTNIDNQYYAVDNKCTHMGGSLYLGKMEGKTITCPRHGSVFDLTTGKAVGEGKLLFIRINAHDLHCYNFKVEGEDILIEIAD